MKPCPTVIARGFRAEPTEFDEQKRTYTAQQDRHCEEARAEVELLLWYFLSFSLIELGFMTALEGAARDLYRRARSNSFLTHQAQRNACCKCKKTTVLKRIPPEFQTVATISTTSRHLSYKKGKKHTGGLVDH